MIHYGKRISRRSALRAGVMADAVLGGLPGWVRSRPAPTGDFGDLASSLDGELVLPTAAEYDDARRVWNGMIDRRPAAIARCASVGDVQAAVRFARRNGIPVSVRGGGHNVAGKAVRDDALMIDLGAMQSVGVDPERRKEPIVAGVAVYRGPALGDALRFFRDYT
jgi:hypothetical protein